MKLIGAVVEGSPIRKFETGATRDTDNGKYDYEAFLSPIVLERYAQYLHKHRLQTNGDMRPGDNWQRGIPKDVYMKSLIRHTMDAWKLHRGYTAIDIKTKEPIDIEDALSGVMFNTMGYIFENLKEKN
jgi:hypothetical protein